MCYFLGHKEVAQLLIDNGADINAKTKNGETPLKLATSQNNSNFECFVFEEKKRFSLHALLYHSTGRTKEIAQLLRDKGAM